MSPPTNGNGDRQVAESKESKKVSCRVRRRAHQSKRISDPSVTKSRTVGR